jgi:hypothetical protein
MSFPTPRAGGEGTRPRQDPPELTWPEPELDDGGLVVLSPLEPVDVLELPELVDVLELPELVEPVELLDGAFDDELDAGREVDACCPVEDACAEPGSVAAIAPAARTPVSPAVAVSVRIRCWFRSRAMTAARRDRSYELRLAALSPVVIVVLCLSSSLPTPVRRHHERALLSVAAELLKDLSARYGDAVYCGALPARGLPLVADCGPGDTGKFPQAVDRAVDEVVETGYARGINSGCPVDDKRILKLSRKGLVLGARMAVEISHH